MTWWWGLAVVLVGIAVREVWTGINVAKQQEREWHAERRAAYAEIYEQPGSGHDARM